MTRRKLEINCVKTNLSMTHKAYDELTEITEYYASQPCAGTVTRSSVVAFIIRKAYAEFKDTVVLSKNKQ